LGVVLYCLSFSSFAADEASSDAATASEAEATTTEGAESEALSDNDEYIAWATAIWESLDKQAGEIKLDGTNATLNVPSSFYYLNPADSEKVLSEVWGNPPGSSVLGMLFPSDMTPFDQESWAVTIDYQGECE